MSDTIIPPGNRISPDPDPLLSPPVTPSWDGATGVVIEEDPLIDDSMDDFSDEPDYQYGWRDVKKVGPDGKEEWVQVPLTRDNVLHPRMGDVLLNNEPHQALCNYLLNVFNAQLQGDPTAVVFHDVGIYWDVPGLRHHSPDISVIVGVKKRRKWRSFRVRREKVRPSLLIEITSRDTRKIDLEDKKRHYERAGAPLYVVIDMDEEEGTTPVRLVGHQLTPEGYVPMPVNEKGWLWLEPVKLWIGIKDQQVECYDEHRNRVGSYVEISNALASEVKAREAEVMAREEAEERVRRLEAELRRLRENR